MSTTEKTIKEWVMTLPASIADRAMRYEQDHWDMKFRRLHNALISGFGWKETVEGFDYWVEVYRANYKYAESLLKNDFRSENSREAHESLEKQRVYKIILTTLNFSNGMTKDEIAENSNLTPEQVHKRMSELVRIEKVVPNGKRKGKSGRNQTIWTIK